MSQQINLLGPRFRKAHVLLSASFMVAGACMALVLALLVQGVVQFRANRFEQQAATATRTIEAEQSRLNILMQENDPAIQSRRLDEEISHQEMLLADKREVITLLQSGELGDTHGYSNYLRAFARQVVPDLWLTGFAISAAGKHIAIDGATLRPDLVPKYINRLRGEPVMQGRLFAMLTMRPPKVEGQQEPGTVKTTPAYLLFTLSSDQEMPKDGSTATSQSGSRAERYAEYARIAQEAQEGGQ